MRSIELFVGAGGLGMGVAQAGFSPVIVVEQDKYCCDTIRENQVKNHDLVREWSLFEGDIRNFNFSDIKQSIDLVSGGPPCQPFSLGGKHRGYEDNRDMFPQAIRAVRELKPKAFIFENVKGLTRQSFSNYLEYLRLQLTYPELVTKDGEKWSEHFSCLERHHTASQKYVGLQYRIVIRLLNAADYGVPQKRERIFIIGFRSDLGIEWTFPLPTHNQDMLLWEQWKTEEYWDRHKIVKAQRPEPGKKNRFERFSKKPTGYPWVTVRDVISELPDPELNSKAVHLYLNHKFQSGARSYSGHTGSPLDQPAKTLKAGDHGVPGGENMLLRPDGSVRYFTVRESARLQTFPDNYTFHGSWSETMRQLGNAVPVKLAKIVAESVASQLSGTR